VRESKGESGRVGEWESGRRGKPEPRTRKALVRTQPPRQSIGAGTETPWVKDEPIPGSRGFEQFEGYEQTRGVDPENRDMRS